MLMNPHCLECAQDKECRSCDFLRQELADAKRLNSELLSKILASKEEPKPVERVMEELKPIQPKSIPWAVKRQILEQESRERAKVMKGVEDLEKEMKLDLSSPKPRMGSQSVLDDVAGKSG